MLATRVRRRSSRLMCSSPLVVRRRTRWASGYNIRWLLRRIARKGIAFLLRLYLRLLRLAAMGPKSLRPRLMHAQPALG